MIAIIRNSLKDENKLKEFNASIEMALNLTEKKRFYISDYGYENVRGGKYTNSNTLHKTNNSEQ